ncbi:hypothetical protein GCM10027515_17940 [Schumannella luteola]|uniref:Uncharacterized protein n=1 Tax=Schumannella luteola TaxID=472059 RepID=A0A852YRS5_9MICO|nr:hypothetical protein [Schumannella luteola]NYH00410.1 hypothetical protein [Schumannella luteola]TPX03678.1 hypothetical protein FJ656_16030 [Schumannella luteola]
MSSALQSRAARTARGALAGTTAMVLAAASHGFGGGDIPGWLAIAVGLVVAVLLGTLLTAKTPSLPRLLAIVLPSQAAFHYLFVLLGGPGLAVARHAHPGAGSSALDAAGPATGVTGSHLQHITEPRMLAAHLVAAVLTVVLLRWAEAALWTLLVRLAEPTGAPAAALRSALLALGALAGGALDQGAAASPRASASAAALRRALRSAARARGSAVRLRSALLVRASPLRGPPLVTFA